jgi:uncharacterized membrane protein YeaQ/YmgE (transglycosylase-associated protein family)
MGFLAFVYLLIISIVVVSVLRNLPKLKLKKIKLPDIKLPGGIITAIIVGYIGARLGVILFGNWQFLNFQGVSLIPALLGAIAAILLAKTGVECCKK